eukprot:scaffold7465_cov239-Pinguiococcus_pyrenoidosus.AAC.3
MGAARRAVHVFGIFHLLDNIRSANSLSGGLPRRRLQKLLPAFRAYDGPLRAWWRSAFAHCDFKEDLGIGHPAMHGWRWLQNAQCLLLDVVEQPFQALHLCADGGHRLQDCSGLGLAWRLVRTSTTFHELLKREPESRGYPLGRQPSRGEAVAQACHAAVVLQGAVPLVVKRSKHCTHCREPLHRALELAFQLLLVIRVASRLAARIDAQQRRRFVVEIPRLAEMHRTLTVLEAVHERLQPPSAAQKQQVFAIGQRRQLQKRVRQAQLHIEEHLEAFAAGYARRQSRWPISGDGKFVGEGRADGRRQPGGAESARGQRQSLQRA